LCTQGWSSTRDSKPSTSNGPSQANEVLWSSRFEISSKQTGGMHTRPASSRFGKGHTRRVFPRWPRPRGGTAAWHGCVGGPVAGGGRRSRPLVDHVSIRSYIHGECARCSRVSPGQETTGAPRSRVTPQMGARRDAGWPTRAASLSAARYLHTDMGNPTFAMSPWCSERGAGQVREGTRPSGASVTSDILRPPSDQASARNQHTRRSRLEHGGWWFVGLGGGKGLPPRWCRGARESQARGRSPG